jgi:hypothetical protein
MGIFTQTFVNTVVVENLRFIWCLHVAYAQVTMVLCQSTRRTVFVWKQRKAAVMNVKMSFRTRYLVRSLLLDFK